MKICQREETLFNITTPFLVVSDHVMLATSLSLYKALTDFPLTSQTVKAGKQVKQICCMKACSSWTTCTTVERSIELCETLC